MLLFALVIALPLSLLVARNMSPLAAALLYPFLIARHGMAGQRAASNWVEGSAMGRNLVRLHHGNGLEPAELFCAPVVGLYLGLSKGKHGAFERRNPVPQNQNRMPATRLVVVGSLLSARANSAVRPALAS